MNESDLKRRKDWPALIRAAAGPSGGYAHDVMKECAQEDLGAFQALVDTLRAQKCAVPVRVTAGAILHNLALIGVKNSNALQALLEAAGDAVVAVRRIALAALMRYGAEVPVIIYVRTLTDDDREIRAEAAHHLARQGWQPDETVPIDGKAAYWVHNEHWQQCVELGAPAVRFLIELLGDTRSNLRRRAVATTLVQIYRSGNLDTNHRRLIMGQRPTIEEKHTDTNTCTHTDNSARCGSEMSYYAKRHTDTGIGLDLS